MPKLRMERTEYALITDGVGENEQTLAAGKPFWVFFVANIGVSPWVMGVLFATMGLNFADGMFVLLFGSLIGSALPAALATLGPKTRLSQIEMGRLSLGRTGKKLPGFLNWVNSIGWDVINNIFSAAALVLLLKGFNLPAPLWLVLGVLVGAQLLIGVYGHHMIQETSRYTGVLLGLFFIVIGIIAMHQAHGFPAPTKSAALKDVVAAMAMIIANNAGGWSPFAADYTRYLPKNTPSRSIFLPVFAALFLSMFVLGFFGFMTASVVTDATPGGVMDALQGLSGRFAPVVLLLIGFSAIPPNAVNDNSAAYSLMSAGVKLTRPVAAIIGAVIGYVICLSVSDSFIDFFENFLFLMIHWVGPWAAIVLVHWLVVGKKEQKTPSGITSGCIVFVAVTLASLALFASNSLYNGLLSGYLGGVDIGPYVGFVTAGLIYYAVLRLKGATHARQ